ncbi:MAG TPA: HEAT repeat domain-containing protein [Pyrinomonadaceae bacterium]
MMPRLLPQITARFATVSALALLMLVLLTGIDASAQRRSRPRPVRETPQQQGNTQTAQKRPQKTITPLRSSDTNEGSRITIRADAPLNDYSAYRSGDRYYVVIPDANAPGAQSGLRGRGFEDVKVQKRGNDTILSFKLQPGTNARVSQRFENLDVVLTTPGKGGANVPTTAKTEPTPTTVATPQPTPRSTPQITTGQEPVSRQGTEGQIPVVPTPGINSQTGNPALAGTTPPVIAAPTPEVAASPGVGQEASPAQTPNADELAQVQAPPAQQPITTAASSDSSETTGTSFGAVLQRNWLIILIGALVLIGLFMIVAARSREQRSAPPTPSRKLRLDKKLAAREMAAKESALADKSSAVKASGAAVVTTAAAAAALADDEAEAEKVEAVAAVVEEEKASVAVETPAAAAVEEEVKTVPAVDVERVDSEIKNVLAGESYDEAIIGASDAGTRQLIATELLAALAARNVTRRERAREAFIKYNYLDEATRNLRTAEAPAERAAAARSLGFVKDKSTTPHLVAALEDKAPEVRRASVEALAELNDPAAVEPLSALLERERDRKVPKNLIRRAIEASAVAEEETITVEAEKPSVSTADIASPEAVADVALSAGGAVVEEIAAAEEEEARRRAAEEESARRAAEEAAAARALAEEEERQRAEEEARLRAEEEARRQAEEERLRAEEEVRLAAEAEAQRIAEEEAHLAALAEARRLAEEEEARRKAEEEERVRAEAEAKRLAEEEERRRAEEERLRAEAEAARLRAEEEARQRAIEEEERRQAEEAARLAAEAARLKAEEERRQAEEAARLKAEEEARARAEEEARLRAEEEARAEAERLRLEEEARQRAEEEARLRAEEEARLAAEAEAQRLAEEQRLAAEAEAKRLAEEEEARREEEERLRAEAEARRVAEEEARLAAEAEARRLAEEEAERRAAEEARLRAEEEERLRLEEEARQRAMEEAARAEASLAEPLIEHHDGATSGWVEVDMAEPEIVRHARPISAAIPEVSAESIEVEPDIESAEPVVRESREIEPARLSSVEEPIAEAYTPQVEYLPTEKGIANLDEFSTVPIAILKRLGSEEPAERATAVIDLARVGGDDSFREISAAFDDPSVEVRNAAARSLFQLNTDRAATFTRALREAPPERRRKIGSALASSGLASEAIGQLMGESREKTYDAFSLLFLMSKAGEVQPLMRAIEEHPNNEVRLAVVKLLALSGQQEILPAFRRLAVRGSLPTEVRSAVMEAIYQISSQSPTAA